MLERHVALDVGRIIFDGLNSLEFALNLTILTLLFRNEALVERIWALPVITSMILLLQVFYLTPVLEIRAFHIACEELANKKHARKAEENAYKAMKARITLSPMPSKRLHDLYIICEFIKVGLLMKFGYDIMLNL